MKTISIVVSGKVQGVWFRKYTEQKAKELHVTGYVQNLQDNHVYIIATGTENQLKQFAEWCYGGSPLSKVKGVEVNDLPLQLFDDFTISR